jgi:hypothetical protein
VAKTLFDLSLSCFVLQWQELFAIIKQAKRNNSGKAWKYPETRKGLLALQELDLDSCKLTGIVLTALRTRISQSQRAYVGLKEGGGMVWQIQIKNI